jgi:hypothetical protein
MQETKHTPGPWVAVQMNHRWHGSKPLFPDGLWHIVPTDDYERVPIATVDRADDHDEQTRAEAGYDARLIAAAPEMFALLVKFADFSEVRALLDRIRGAA